MAIDLIQKLIDTVSDFRGLAFNTVAVSALLLYETIITFPEEVNHVWTWLVAVVAIAAGRLVLNLRSSAAKSLNASSSETTTPPRGFISQDIEMGIFTTVIETNQT
ncbi:hypothetical protein M422DRAFT_267695 [Sphaerobolus stellatus SS14]|uniref:DUF6533 domain-containing protein n=1 Tax=Sphaerobolus stellatus (strain SS14) TaxID=990650 RepID=A0A0C9TLI1_SPHS4|nr:hypothetical protein M422DRAFT_267695 [Sphaerobolus stellatus SS14]